ncbi:MAG: NAD(P) transhydrogenase subunit alpha, partial [Ruaniaceae bacterium]|nr:NAD(P) transhydrogenase subunit alpha [Ruaniaceae bacterium]
MEFMTSLTILVLAAFVGVEVVSKVTSTLHTPLMSGANAIHGIILVGALIVTAHATNPLLLILSIIAVVLASMNLVGGFVVTDRMLEMFSGKKKVAKKSPSSVPRTPRPSP